MRLLVISRDHDLAYRPYDGFSRRHLDLLDGLIKEFDIGICLLEGGDTPSQAVLHRTEARLPASPEVVPGRLHRLLRAAEARIGRLDAPGRALATQVERAGADALLTIGPWVDVGYRAAYGSTPSMYLFEEDLTRMPELAPQSRQARLLRRAENMLRSTTRQQPDVVVVISSSELPYAQRRFPKAEMMVLPYCLPSDQVPVRGDWQASGSHVFVPGVLSEARNAEGVAEVLDQLHADSSDIPILFCSATGYHESLHPHLSHPSVTTAEPSERSLASCYDMAKVVLIAPKRVTGSKTTLVEAWAARRPVVCSSPVAAAAPEDATAYLEAESPRALAVALRTTWNDGLLRDRLVASGDAALRKRCREVHVGRLVTALRALAG